MDNNSELNKELNKRLSEVLIEHEEGSRGSGMKKILLVVAIALIVLAVVLVVFWKTTREPAKSAPIAVDKSLQKVGNVHENNFENLTLEPSANKKQEDKFDQIVQDIQSRQAKPESTDNTSKLLALPTSPLDKKPTEIPKSDLKEKQIEIHQEKPSPVAPQKHAQEKHGEKHEKHGEKVHHKHPESEHSKGSAKAHEKAHEKIEKHHEKSALHEEKHPHKQPHKTHEQHSKTPPTHNNIAHATPKEIFQSKDLQTQKLAKAHEPSKPHEKASSHPTPLAHKTTAGHAHPHPTNAIPKGIYLQVGVFSKTPNAKFLEAIKKYPHKIQDIKGQKRYLIGPYADKQKADAQIAQITEQIGKPVHVEIK